MRESIAQKLLVARYVLRRIGLLALRAAQTLLAPIGFPEVLLFSGSGLLGYGLSFAYPPALWIAPGAIIAGIAIFLYVATFKPAGS